MLKVDFRKQLPLCLQAPAKPENKLTAYLQNLWKLVVDNDGIKRGTKHTVLFAFCILATPPFPPREVEWLPFTILHLGIYKTY